MTGFSLVISPLEAASTVIFCVKSVFKVKSWWGFLHSTVDVILKVELSKRNFVCSWCYPFLSLVDQFRSWEYKERNLKIKLYVGLLSGYKRLGFLFLTLKGWFLSPFFFPPFFLSCFCLLHACYFSQRVFLCFLSSLFVAEKNKTEKKIMVDLIWNLIFEFFFSCILIGCRCWYRCPNPPVTLELIRTKCECKHPPP